MPSTILLFCLSMGFSCTSEQSTAIDIATDDQYIPIEDEPLIESIQIHGDLPIHGERSIIVETMFDTLESVKSLEGASFLLQRDGQIAYMDETVGEGIALGSRTIYDGTVMDSRETLLALDGLLYVFDGEWLENSPLNEIIPIPIEKVEGDKQLLWLQGADMLYRYSAGNLMEIQPPAQQELRLFAASQQGMAAIAAPYPIIFDGQSETATVTDYRNDVLPLSMTFDSGENLWLSDGSPILYHRSPEHEWSGLDAGSAIIGVYGNPSSESIWIRTENAVIHRRGGVFHSVEVPAGEWLDVDEWGRILLHNDGTLQRIAVERSVAVSGILKNGILDAPTTIAYAPTDWETLESIHAWVDEDSLAIDPDTLESTLNPNDFATGAHRLRILAEGPEGHTMTEVPFVIGELPDVKWEEELELITVQHCNQCHGEGSFMPLYTAGQWEQTIDLIISEVVSNSMPKGGPYLSDAEIQMIRGWKNGGFQ